MRESARCASVGQENSPGAADIAKYAHVRSLHEPLLLQLLPADLGVAIVLTELADRELHLQHQTLAVDNRLSLVQRACVRRKHRTAPAANGPNRLVGIVRGDFAIVVPTIRPQRGGSATVRSGD